MGLLISNIDKKVRKGLIKAYVWNRALYRRKLENRNTGSVCYEMLQKFGEICKVINEGSLLRLKYIQIL